MKESWVDRHSVNCFKCGILFDEREGVVGPGGEGTICPTCNQNSETTAELTDARPLLDVILAGNYGKQWVNGMGVRWGFDNESEILAAALKYQVSRNNP
jgi:hypothetical protein